MAGNVLQWVQDLTKLSVLSDPRDVRVQRLCELICTGLELFNVIEKDKIQPCNRLRQLLVLDATADDGCEPLVLRNPLSPEADG
jgi:hypothetical protein